MTGYRRLTFQLASLLDLLLIVMFSQYLEVQIIAEQQVDRLESEQKSSEAEVEQLRGQLETTGRIFGEMFRLPESTVQKFVQQRNQDGVGMSAEEIAGLQKEFQSLASANGTQVVDHLLTYVEMKKRFDVWELFIEENGAILVTSGTHQKKLQTGVVATPEQFSDELFRIYKSFPQTKSIVLILVSYGDARLVHRTAVLKGLPLVTERMRVDSNGTTRFEYAVLGYRPEGPER